MKNVHVLNTALAGVVVFSVLSFAGMANAACVNSKWNKVSGNSFAQIVHGRLCGVNMSVKFTGAVNTGWIAMYGGANQFNATYVDNNVTTNISLQTTGNTMHVNFIHVDNGGATSLPQGNYQLLSMQ